MGDAGWLSAEEASTRFGLHSSSVRALARTNVVRSFRPDPDRPASSSNALHVWSGDLEEHLIKRGQHPDAWPDQSVPRFVDPLPVVGSTDGLRSDQIGNAGEHLVAYYLSLAGASVSLVDRRGMDHFVRMPNGSMFALEVKTASKPYVTSDSTKVVFGINRRDADWFGFLDLSTNVVLFKPVEEAEWSIAHRFFTPFYMNQSIQRLFDYYGDEPDPVLQEAAA